jgi:hypothetical protein
MATTKKALLGRRLQGMKKAEIISEVFDRAWKINRLEEELVYLKGRSLWARIIDKQILN